jgi:hypothetical protein
MVWNSTQNAFTLTISGSVNNTPWDDGIGTLVLTGPGGVSTGVPIQVA